MGSVITCSECGDEYGVGMFPFCKGKGSHTAGANLVIADDIPGGLVIKHGLVNKDGSPRTFYSHSEIKRVSKEMGYENQVRHVTSAGTDKNKWTTKWF